MNRIHHRHHVRGIAAVLGAFAASALALVTGATTALASSVPPPAGPAGLVPLPVRAQAIVAGGMPGWQIALIALGAALAAAALAVTLAERTSAQWAMFVAGGQGVESQCVDPAGH
jgi:hypothetical protein